MGERHNYMLIKGTLNTKIVESKRIKMMCHETLQRRMRECCDIIEMAHVLIEHTLSKSDKTVYLVSYFAHKLYGGKEDV